MTKNRQPSKNRDRAGTTGRNESEAASAKGQLRCQAILEAARHVMVREGYGALSLRRVARECGLVLSHVQYYFASREALLRGILTAHLDAARQAVQEQGDRDLAAVVAVVLRDQQARDSCQIFWELWAIAGQDRKVAALMAEFYAEYVASVLPFVQALAPTLSRREAEIRAVLMVAMLEGLSLFRGHGRQAPVPQQALDRAVPAMLQAIASADGILPPRRRQ